ncbi:hypothetical protein [Paraflavitalea pollutisoli]|uniref:hypothetical protein n=1 Tax=Paraflavitalea pollutisoli TaxID=3034143 RepID=UPI0023ED63F4|nr:hypothetical protein [Paraflavitalea sp. H1-2-19X]
MIKLTVTALFAGIIISCQTPPAPVKAAPALIGTWKLQTGTLIEKGDTVVTDYTKGQSFIKIINDDHFAFLHHDLAKGKDSAAIYSSGGGSYTLKDSLYTEHLEYCTARQWEGNSFEFTVTIKGDTLVQRGVEHIKDLGVDRLNIEQYVRLK